MKSVSLILTMLVFATSAKAATVIEFNSQKLGELLNNQSVMAKIHSVLSRKLPGETIDLKSAEWAGSRFDHRTDTHTVFFVLKYDNFSYTGVMPSKKCQVLATSVSTGKDSRSEVTFSVTCP